MRFLLAFSALMCLSFGITPAQAADSAPSPGGQQIQRTPYDPYLGKVRAVLQENQLHPGASISDREVGKLMMKARRFRYRHDTPYVPQDPAETEQTRAGDCKDKSLWLLSVLKHPQARFVVGRYGPSSQISHAWVLYPGEKGWLILDPTMNWDPISLSRVAGGKSYRMTYSWSAGSTFAHTAGEPISSGISRR